MNRERKQIYIKAISLLSFFSIIFCASTVIFALQNSKLKMQNEIENQRALSELCENLDNITVSLQKSMYTGTKEKLAEIGNDLNRQASCAKVNLGQVTDEDIITDEIYKFLSQIGAYTLSLCEGNDELTISKKNSENLKSLYEYSKALSDGLSDVVSLYFDGGVTMEKKVSTLKQTSAEIPENFGDKITDIEQSLTDYPTLIYDGPFADEMLGKNGSEMLKNKNEITRKEAQEKAAETLGASPSALKTDEDNISDIELYCFSKGDISIGITKKGGMVCYFLNPYFASEETISEKEAVERAKKFLTSLGYKDMRETYYSDYDGVCTINFAYMKNGIVHYSDLIKVSVALDTGEITAFDSTVYLKNHLERDIYDEEITVEQARERISKNLKIIGEKSAVIPLETGKEAYCYEFHCKDSDGNEVLVYIDKKTGQERDILLLLYADGGVLTK